MWIISSVVFRYGAGSQVGLLWCAVVAGDVFAHKFVLIVCLLVTSATRSCLENSEGFTEKERSKLTAEGGRQNRKLRCCVRTQCACLARISGL
jgi:hypothetical protein